MYELMIIGGGPAGLAAAVYAARKRVKTLLLTHDIGGQMNWTMHIENYLGYQFVTGPELISKFQEQVAKYPIDQIIGKKVATLEKSNDRFEATTTEGEKYQAVTVIFATGKSPKRLKVPGEGEFMGKGVTYCATCDGPLFAGRRIAVIGGGNSALETAIDMTKIAEWVYLVSVVEFTADAILVEKLSEAKNVNTLVEHAVERIEGKDFVDTLVVKNMKNGEIKRLPVGGVFVEIGLTPNSQPVEGLLKLNEIGEVPVGCLSETEIPGLYAAGDVTTVPEKQIVIAAGEGAKAALQAHRYLQHLAKVPA